MFSAQVRYASISDCAIRNAPDWKYLPLSGTGWEAFRAAARRHQRASSSIPRMATDQDHSMDFGIGGPGCGVLTWKPVLTVALCSGRQENPSTNILYVWISISTFQDLQLKSAGAQPSLFYFSAQVAPVSIWETFKREAQGWIRNVSMACSGPHGDM